MRKPKELFDAIVELAKSVGTPVEESTVTDSNEEVVVSPNEVVEEEVVLEEVSSEEVVLEDTPEVDAPAEVVAPVASVSKAEFDSAIAEIKEMYTKVLESISPSTTQEVPAELSEETVTEEVVEESVELSEVDETTDDLVHDPEGMVEKKQTFLYAQNRTQTTEDVVFKSLFNSIN